MHTSFAVLYYSHMHGIHMHESCYFTYKLAPVWSITSGAIQYGVPFIDLAPVIVAYMKTCKHYITKRTFQAEIYISKIKKLIK